MPASFEQITKQESNTWLIGVYMALGRVIQL